VTLRKCNRPDCSGVFIDDGDGPRCNLCGRPPEPEPQPAVNVPEFLAKHQRLNWLMANLEQIMADLRHMSREEVEAKWKLSRRSFGQLKRSWKLRQGIKVPETELFTPAAPPAPQSDVPWLQGLPPWRDDWPELVQLRYFDTLLELAKLNK